MNNATSTLNKYYESLKSCETIDELDQKYKIIHEDMDLTLREHDILSDIYNYQKIIIPTMITKEQSDLDDLAPIPEGASGVIPPGLERTIDQINADPKCNPPAEWVKSLPQDLLNDINTLNFNNCYGLLRSYRYEDTPKDAHMKNTRLRFMRARCGVEVVGHTMTLRVDGYSFGFKTKTQLKKILKDNNVKGRSKLNEIPEIVRALININ